MDAYQRARRRMNQLACHVGVRDSSQHHRPLLSRAPASAPAFRAFGETFPRRDHRTLFARQSSDGYGQFMRQVVRTEDEDETRLRPPATVGPARCCKAESSSTCKDTSEALQSSLGTSFASVAPLFSRPARQPEPISEKVTDGKVQNHDPLPSVSQEIESTPKERCSSELPESPGQASTEIVKPVSPPAKEQPRLQCHGFEWFPRMDVVESGTAYVITVELPGVSADGIHVEIVRGSLVVTGSRATDWWKGKNDGNNGGGTVYHRRELAQGPYRAAWSLPKKVDINGITAEFIDGFLRVLVPKIKTVTYL